MTAGPWMLRAHCGEHQQSSCPSCSLASGSFRRCSAIIAHCTIGTPAPGWFACGPSERGCLRPMPLRRLGVFVATCAHVGYAPVAPGTFGSLVALVLYYLIRRQQSTTIELGAIAVIVVIGLWSATEAEHHFGGIDPGPVVIDEVVGMLMTLALHPVNIWGAIVGFLIFRVLDIVKPWPARRLELLPGGFGVVLDDMMAGVYGNLIVWGLVSVLPSWFT